MDPVKLHNIAKKLERSNEGATGISDRGGATLTCRVAADGRLRWKR